MNVSTALAVPNFRFEPTPIEWRGCVPCDVLWEGDAPCWSCGAPGKRSEGPDLRAPSRMPEPIV